jgi:gliding motility-associated-like protein
LAISKNILLALAINTIFVTFSNGQSSDLGTVCAESSHVYGVVGSPSSTFIWAVEKGGSISDNDGEDTILVNWGHNTGQYQMEVVEISASGCSGVPSMATVRVQAPEVDLGFDFYDICEGESKVFDASGDYDGTPNYLWHDGSTLSFYTADSTQNIWVRVTDGMGCTRYDSLVFVSHELPNVYLGNDTLLCDEEVPMELDAGNFATYEWTTNNDTYIGNPIYVYRTLDYTDTIRVTITDNNNCKASDTMLVFPCSVAKLFDNLYNTFTPDGDGTNETWVIIDNMDQFPDAVLEIFDRWGRQVYYTRNVAGEPWDGKSKGRDMPMDAYFFVLDLNFGGFEAITGTVNLIR